MLLLLQNILLIIFLFAVLFLSNVKSSYDFVSCSTADDTPPAYILKNSYTFFQSPNFPKLLSSNMSSCNAQFKSDNETLFIWVAFINGAASNIAISDDTYDLHKLNVQNYDSNFDIITFETWSNSFTIQVNATPSSQQGGGEWTAFQAALTTFSDGTDYTGCPFTRETFDFAANPHLLIPIANNFAQGSDAENKTCNWTFTCSSSQQLKVVVKNVEIADEVELILYGSCNQIVKNFTTDDSSQVYYFYDTSFNLMYEYKFSNTSDIKFFIIVSAVTPSNTFSSNGCQNSQVNASTGETIFTNINYDIGYPPYQRCENSIIIPENHEGTLSITKLYYESCCDKLFVQYGTDNQTQLITWEAKQQPIQYILTHDISGTQNNLIFTSDGNIQGVGFTANLQLYECKCADLNFFIPCNNATNIYYPLENSYTYCSNMDCIYMIAQDFSCPNRYFHLIVVNSLRKNSSDDNVLLRENGNIEQNMTSATGALDRYYSTKNSITLQFHSGPAHLPIVAENKFWFVYLTSMPSPNFLPKISLNLNTKSKHILWLPDDMSSNDALTVCAAENGILELFVTTDRFTGESGFLLYDSDDLSYFIGDLNQIPKSADLSSSIPNSIKSTSGCFTIFLPSFSSFNNGHAVVFRVVDATAENNNCQSANTVFQVTYDGEYDISVKSDDSSSCEMIILALTGFPNEIPHIWINNISTTDSTGYFTFMSLVNNKTLFEFDGTEASEWQSIGIYTLALSIVISPSSEISIHLSSNDQISEYINVVESGIQKGIMASPSYCGIMQNFDTSQIYQVTGPVSFAIDFVVKDVYGSPNPVIQNYPNNQTLLQNNNISITAYNFQVYYAENDPQNNGFLVEYIIQGNISLPEEETSTQFPTTTVEMTEATATENGHSTPLFTTSTTMTSSPPTSSSAMPPTSLPTLSVTPDNSLSPTSIPNTTPTNIPSEQPTTTAVPSTTTKYAPYKSPNSGRQEIIGMHFLFINILALIWR